MSHAQDRTGSPAVLSLDAAIRTAQQQNRRVQSARLEIDKATEHLATARSHRRPAIHVNATAGSLLAPLTFRFPAAAFGSFAATGPIPPADATITSDPSLTTFVSATLVQPLTQLPRIGRAERAAALARDLAREQVRLAEGEVAAAVKRMYYGLVQAEAGLRARAESLRLQRELVRLMDEYLEQRVVLPAEALTVRAGLMKQEYDLAALANTAVGYREQLNHLLGRDLDEPLAVEPLQPTVVTADDLRVAETRALADRPEARISRLQSQQAALELAATRRAGLPDASLSFNYTGFHGFVVLPNHGVHLGVLATWEPWDWGRQRAERERKRLVQEQSDIGARDTDAQIRLDVRARFRAVQDGYAVIRVSEAAREAARERLRVATQRLAADAALERELLEAQARLAQSEFEYQQAIAAYWTARAQFEQARGDS